jgi:hypothetical protein
MLNLKAPARKGIRRSGGMCRYVGLEIIVDGDTYREQVGNIVARDGIFGNHGVPNKRQCFAYDYFARLIGVFPTTEAALRAFEPGAYVYKEPERKQKSKDALDEDDADTDE